MKKNGQVSVEFIIILSVLFLLLLFSLWVFSQKNSGFALSKESYEAELLANRLGSAINNVFLAGNGASAFVSNPKSFDFNVSVSGNALIVSWQTAYEDFALLTDNVSLADLNLNRPINVKNNNGVVKLENA